MGPLKETLSKSKIEPTGKREIYRFRPKTAVTNKSAKALEAEKWHNSYWY